MPRLATNPGPYARVMPSSRPIVERRDPRVKVFPYSQGARRLSGFGDDVAAGEAAIAAVKKAYASGGLHGYACRNCERMLRDAKRLGGLGALGLNYSGAASGASAGATVGSAVPVIGTAVGAVVGAIAGALFSKKKDPNQAEKNALSGQLDEYLHVQGSIPGRAFNLTTLKQLIDAAGYRGMWPNVKKWSGDAITGAIEGCRGCTPPTIRQFVKDQVAAGDIDPMSLASKFTDIVNRTWGSKWFVQSAGATQRQLMIDLMDYFIAENKPDAPLFYAPGWTVAAQTPPPPPPVAAPTPVPVPVITPTPAPIAAPVPLPAPAPLPVQPPTTVAPPNAVVTPTPTQPQIDVGALVKSLMDQGASQQQAFLAAMQNLQSQGVPPTPQVQQAVADQVKTAGVGNLPTWAWVAIPVILGGAIVLGRPGKSY